MCGRFSLSVEETEINKLFELEEAETPYIPRFNCAPSQPLPVITSDEPKKLSFFRWGLIPYWAKDSSIGFKMINARSETIFEKPSFKQSILRRRCLIPADAFYEWKKSSYGKIPFRISLKDQEIFAMAGIWDQWTDAAGKLIKSFSVITTKGNSFMENIHLRMPVILSPEHWQSYLNKSESSERVKSILRPYESTNMDAYRISQLVNSPHNEGPDLIAPFA